MAAVTHLSVFKLHNSVINFHICLIHPACRCIYIGPLESSRHPCFSTKTQVMSYLRVDAAVQVSVGQIKPPFNTKENLLSRLVCFSAGPQLVPHCREVAADPNRPLLEFMPSNGGDGLSTIRRQHNKQLPDTMRRRRNINAYLIEFRMLGSAAGKQQNTFTHYSLL